MSRLTSSGWAGVYRVVRRIPFGSVSTYGEIAEIAGMPRAARQVGYALNALDADDDVPWHRVINAKGEISRRGERQVEDLQRALLESEGVEFDDFGRVDLGACRWKPRLRTQVVAARTKKTPKPNESKPRTRTSR